MQHFCDRLLCVLYLCYYGILEYTQTYIKQPVKSKKFVWLIKTDGCLVQVTTNSG